MRLIRLGRLCLDIIDVERSNSEGDVAALPTSSKDLACSVATASNWPIFQPRSSHMHTAAAMYMNPV